MSQFAATLLTKADKIEWRCVQSESVHEDNLESDSGPSAWSRRSSWENLITSSSWYLCGANRPASYFDVSCLLWSYNFLVSFRLDSPYVYFPDLIDCRAPWWSKIAKQRTADCMRHWNKTGSMSPEISFWVFGWIPLFSQLICFDIMQCQRLTDIA